MAEQGQRTGDNDGQPWSFLLRLFAVLAVVVASVLLLKRSMAPERQLQAVLDAEVQALNRGAWKEFEALQDPDDPIFRRHQKSEFDSFLFARKQGQSLTLPAPYVVEVSREGDRAWALVMDDPAGNPAAAEYSRPPAKIEFFRRVYGQWLHTGPDPEYWGQERESRTEHILWRYREADAEQVARLAAVAETLIGQVCDDVGLELEAGALVINLCYAADCGYVMVPPDREMNLPTPLLFGADEEMLEYTMATLLAAHLVNRAAGVDSHSTPASRQILNGVERWEVEQMTGEAPWGDPLLPLRQAATAGTLLSLEEMDQPPDGEDTALIYDQAYTLVEYTVAQYGRQVLPGLVRAANSPSLHSLEGMAAVLQKALGPDLDLAAFEAGWLAFVEEKYGE